MIGMCFMHISSSIICQTSEINEVPTDALDFDAIADLPTPDEVWLQTIHNSTCVTIDQRELVIAFISSHEILSPYELQTIQGIPLDALSCLIHDLNSFQRPLPGRGFRKNHVETFSSIDFGDLDQLTPSLPYLLVRARIKTSQLSSIGFTYEKDNHELYWEHKSGPAFASAFFEKTFKHHIIQRIILGDFRLRIGQGLLFNNFFRKGLVFNELTIPKHGHADFKPFTSINENAALRGAAVKLNFGSKQSIISYLSHRELDGSLKQDSSHLDSIGNLSNSGIHTTENQLRSKNSTITTSGGFSYARISDGLNMSYQLHFDYFNLPISSSLPLYKQWRSSEQLQIANSVGWDYKFKALNIYGELAYRHNEGFSAICGALWSPGNDHRFSMIYRRIPPNAFLRSRSSLMHSQSGNESGLFLGYNYRWNQLYTLAINYDSSVNTWWSYQNSPFKISHRLSLSILKKRRKHYDLRSSFHLLLRDKSSHNSQKSYERKARWQIHYMQVITRGVEWRSRGQLTYYSTNRNTSFGWMMYQEIKAKKIGSNYSINMRLTRYFSPIYENRHYSYESRPIGLFSFPALSGNGTKITTLIGYRLKQASISLFFSYISADVTKGEFGMAIRKTFK